MTLLLDEHPNQVAERLTGRDYISWSAISTYQQCPLKWHFRYVLGLPEGVFPISGLTAGWPPADGFINQRIPPSVAIHRDRYDDSALESEIEAYDTRRHDIFPIAPDKQRRVAEYGVAEYCPWSENVVRQLSVPERPGFREYLKSQGFKLD